MQGEIGDPKLQKEVVEGVAVAGTGVAEIMVEASVVVAEGVAVAGTGVAENMVAVEGILEHRFTE